MNPAARTPEAQTTTSKIHDEAHSEKCKHQFPIRYRASMEGNNFTGEIYLNGSTTNEINEL